MTAKKQSKRPKSPARASAGERREPSGVFLLPVLGLVATGQLMVLGARAREGRELVAGDLFPWMLWALASVAVVVVLRLARFQGSRGLLAGTLLLSGIGVIVRSRVSGATPGVADMSLWIQPAGFALLLGAWWISRGGAGCLRPFWAASLLAAFALAGAMLAVGARFRGGVYAAGGTTPTELFKLFIPLFAAGFFARGDESWQNRPVWRPPVGDAVLLAILWAAFCVLLALKRDLGLVLLLSLTLLVVLVCATRRVSWLVAALGGMVAAAFLVIRHFAHGARRFEAWLNPFADPTGSGWQVLQGLSGLYAGGIMGTGLGSGRPDRVPIASSDFVYAVYGEELGFLGSLLLLALFAHLLRAGARVTRAQNDTFSHLLAAGLTASLGAQILVNIGGVVNLLPVTGITLPLVSQGGSSLWVVCAQLGMLLGLSETRPAGKGRRGAKRKKKTKR